MKRILLALILIVVSILPIFIPSSPVLADASWLTDWDYRKSMTLNASADGALTDYQLPIRIYRSAGADGTEAVGTETGGKVYVSTNCEADYDDIRFTTNDGTTLLDYWIEEYDANDATVWVEFDSIPDLGDIDFYIYYGKADASAYSNGDNTFLFFDHFEGSSLDTDKWTVTGTNYTVGSSRLTITNVASATLFVGKTGAGTNYACRIKGKLILGSSPHYNAHGWANAAASEVITFHADYPTVNQYGANRKTGGSWYSYAIGAGYTGEHIWDIKRNASASILYDIDGANVYAPTTNIDTDTYYGFLYNGLGTSSHPSWDFYLIRKFTSPEPTWGAWGSEEEEPALVLTIASSAGGNVTTPGEGNFNYDLNEIVNISATEDVCYHFVNWTGDTATIANASAASTTINMSTTNKSITANFAITQYTLTYTAGAGGTITGTTPQTINCGSNGSEVTATPNACYYFVNWSDAIETASRTDLNISADLNVTANFASYTYEPPTTLTCNPSATSIELNWILGANTSGVYIRYQIGSYPTTLFDGNSIGIINGDTYEHTGLVSGNSYYYKVWGINGICISTNSTTTLCTTYYGADSGATPGAPTAPDNWTGQLDDTELADLPVYEFGNLVADEGGIPYATFWGLGIMGVMIVIALICYNRTHNVFLTCLSITIGLLALGALGVIPFFAVGLFIIMSLVVTVKEGREI